jgi:predicted secreted protein
MALPANAASVNVSVDDTDYYAVDEMNTFSMKVDGINVDITKFLDTYKGRIQTLKDVVYTFSGFWSKADTTGQLAIRTAWKDDSTLYIKILVDASKGWKQLVKVDSITINTTADGAVEASYQVSGNGDVTVVS